VLREPTGGRQVTLLATGSEVDIALRAADQLATRGVAAAVVSMPCWELFEAQPAELPRRTCSEPRRASASRRRCDSAGIAGSAIMASSSA